MIDVESGKSIREALESGKSFVTVSIDFSGCGEAVYPVTINTAHVHSLIEKLDAPAAQGGNPENVIPLKRVAR